MKHDGFFRKHPVFTGEDLAKHLSSHGEVGGWAQEALLAHHQKAGRIVRVRRGLYAVIPSGADNDSYPVDPFLVAAKLTPDSVLSHHTALEFHGKAYSVHTHITYSASRPLGPLTFRFHAFRGTRFPQALLRAGKVHVGVSTAERAGMELRVAGLERTLVDVLDRPDLSGSWEEIWRSLESVESFDLYNVVEYALLLGNATTGAKVGAGVRMQPGCKPGDMKNGERENPERTFSVSARNPQGCTWPPDGGLRNGESGRVA